MWNYSYARLLCMVLSLWSILHEPVVSVFVVIFQNCVISNAYLWKSLYICFNMYVYWNPHDIIHNTEGLTDFFLLATTCLTWRLPLDYKRWKTSSISKNPSQGNNLLHSRRRVRKRLWKSANIVSQGELKMYIIDIFRINLTSSCLENVGWEPVVGLFKQNWRYSCGWECWSTRKTSWMAFPKATKSLRKLEMQRDRELCHHQLFTTLKSM